MLTQNAFVYVVAVFRTAIHVTKLQLKVVDVDTALQCLAQLYV